MWKISNVRIILAGSLAVIGLAFFFEKDNLFGVIELALAGFAFEALSPDEDLTIGDPVELRERYLNSTAAKQFGLKSMKYMDPNNLEYETMLNRSTDDEIVVFYKLSFSGWYDIEVWKKKFKKDEIPLLAVYNHTVEERSLGVFRSAIRNAFASYGIKGALNYLKKEGIDDNLLKSFINNKDDKKEK